MAKNGRKNAGGKKKEIDSKVLNRIYYNYDNSNRRMVEEMELSTEHGGLTGGYREGMWLSFFRSIIPLKYQLAQGVIIIDSEGRASNEVDIAVYDETYTPYVFQYNTLKFIPIEAVVMVIECKSKSYNSEALIKWSKSIKKLTPAASGIARIVQGYAMGETNRSQTRTRPIRVLVSLKVSDGEKKRLKPAKNLGDSFDFILEEERASAALEQKEPGKRFALHIPYEDRTLGWWGEVLNQGAGSKLEPDKPLKLEQLDKASKMEQELRKICESSTLSEEEKTRKLSELEKKIAITRADQKKGLEAKYPELRFNDRLELDSTLSDLRVWDNALLTLNLQLNQLLMLLNNPMMFPHFAYARAFNKYGSPAVPTSSSKEVPREDVTETVRDSIVEAENLPESGEQEVPGE